MTHAIRSASRVKLRRRFAGFSLPTSGYSRRNPARGDIGGSRTDPVRRAARRSPRASRGARFRRGSDSSGLVDSHVHINDPGRADWEGFETATRAAAAGGYTLLVDMPLNCLPATTSVFGLELKRAAARERCRIDWAAWGGVVHHNKDDIAALAAAGVLGFK